MKKYYLSRYLAFIDLDRDVLMFSGFSGNMDVLDGKFALKLRSAAPGADPGFMKPGELSFFRERGYVTDLPPEAERAAFKKLILARHAVNVANAKKSAVLTLLLGYDCNLYCEYCYQKDLRPRKLGARFSKELLDLVLRRRFSDLFPGVKPGDLTLTLYGGEPLLPANLPIIREVLSYSAENGIKTSAISNGVSLEPFSGLLGPLPGQINNVQVTLDAGDYKGVSLQRAGGSKFDKIVSNIHLMLDRKAAVSIRMHVNGSNYAGLLDMVNYLASQDIVGHPKCHPYLFPVMDYTTSDPEKFYRPVDTANPLVREMSRKLGYPLNTKVSSMEALFSLLDHQFDHTIYCMHSRPNAFVVDPYGDLYGCLVEAGREEFRLGTVSRDGVSFTRLLDLNRSRNVGNIKECLDCPYALLCAGACAYAARALHGKVLAPNCLDNKDTIAEAIRFSYMKSRRNAAGRPPK